MNINNIKSSTLVFYSLPNFAGEGTQVAHGQSGIIAASLSNWSQESVSLTNENLLTYIWSGVDTGNQTQSYLGHYESYVVKSIYNLKTTYPSPEYPLQYVGLDNTLAVPVIVEMTGSFSGSNVFAATASVPASDTTVTTLAMENVPGALGFVGKEPGSSTFVSLMFGKVESTTGLVTWKSAGALTLVFDGNQVTLNDVTDLPPGWIFAMPEEKADGSWLVSLTEGTVPETGTLFSLANYEGTTQELDVYQSVQVNSGAGWLWDSVKMNELPLLMYSSFNALDTTYHYNTYQQLRLKENTPDFAAVFTGNTPVQQLALSENDIQVNIKVSTSSSNAAVLVMTQTYPLSFATAATPAQPGVLGILAPTGIAQEIAVKFGSLNGDGTATLGSNGTLNLSLNGSTPMITAGTGIPANWVFDTPLQQADGSWLTTLTETVPVAYIEDLTTDTDSIINSGSDVATLTATVKDNLGEFVAGETIYWSTSLGELNAQSTVTNDNGIALATLTAESVSGTATVTAQLENGSVQELTIIIEDYNPLVWRGEAKADNPVKNITFSDVNGKPSTTMMPYQFTFILDADNGSGAVTYTSTNSNVVSIISPSSGNFKVQGKGTANIVATDANQQTISYLIDTSELKILQPYTTSVEWFEASETIKHDGGTMPTLQQMKDYYQEWGNFSQNHSSPDWKHISSSDSGYRFWCEDYYGYAGGCYTFWTYELNGQDAMARGCSDLGFCRIMP